MTRAGPSVRLTPAVKAGQVDQPGSGTGKQPTARQGGQSGGSTEAVIEPWLDELFSRPRLVSQHPRDGQLWCCESPIPLALLASADRYLAAATLASSALGLWCALWQPKPLPYRHSGPQHSGPQHFEAEPPPLSVAIGRLPLGSAPAPGLLSLADCQRLAADHPQLEWFGGLSFDTADLDPKTWGQLAEGGFFSPRWLVTFAGPSSDPAAAAASPSAPTLAVYGLITPDSAKEPQQQAAEFFRNEEYPQLSAALQHWAKDLKQREATQQRSAEAEPMQGPEDTLPAVLTAEESPSYADWQQLLGRALHQADSDGKVVLARQKTFTFSGPVQLTPVVMNLATLNPASYLFALSAPDGRCFVGCSPERLARWHDDQVEIDAMAGTRPHTPQEPSDGQAERAAASFTAPASELQQNPKDQHEHRFVTDFIHESLGQFCKDFRQETTESVVTLRHLTHMASRFEGTLDARHHPLKLVEHLHPTPAVGGSPRQDALEFLRHNEPFSRGRFAAPIGNFNGQRGDFAIGIRSALVATDQLHVFAGAGIVKGSDPLLEWQEISVKMKNFTDIITHCPASTGSRDSQPHRHKDIS